MSAPSPKKPGLLRRAPAGVLALGSVSMLMDTSSEMIHSLLPLFMVGALGLGPLAVGLIDGLSEAAAALVKIWSGVLSDRLGRRKPLALAGYGLGALSKPLFPLAASAGAVFAARFIDRIGKGIRGAPRDALVADMTPPEQRGAAYGLRQAVDNLGAVFGPLAAMALMAAFNDDYRTVFWLAVIPAFLSVAVLAIAVKEPPRPPEVVEEHAKRRGKPWRFRHLRRLPAAFWVLTAAAAVMVAARFSEAFLLLRAADVGMTAALTPLALVAMNVVYAAAAYPAGVWTDGRGRFGVLAGGMAAMAAAHAVLALASGPAAVLAGSALWGLHMALTQSVLAAAVSDCAPRSLLGTAFGMFHLLTGLALLAGGGLAGLLWTFWGAEAMFWGGAALSVASGLGLLAAARMKPVKQAGPAA